MAPLLALALAALAAPAGAVVIPAIPGAPPSGDEPAAVEISPTASAGELATRYIEAIRVDEKLALLQRLAATKARQPQDLRAMLNLYSRSDPEARKAVERSLSLLSPRDAALAPVFTALLNMDDPAFQQFALMGAYAVRDAEALPVLRKLAETPLSKEPGAESSAQEAAAWQLGIQAVQALALWQGDKAYPLLLKKAQETPLLAEPLARQYWPRFLPELVRWSESSDAKERERASRAWNAQIPVDLLRQTAPELRRIVLDRGKRAETRHGAAIQLGLCASSAAVAGLLADRQASKDDATRRLLAAAIFASRDPQAVPLLEEFARGASDPIARAGALAQLKELAPPAKYRELLRWTAEHDPDEENRGEAARQLAGK
ncbi:MAG TPA: hypothetical protein VNI01_12890 [Elusimicrobiota bacterium]|jgi:hypothetical protein|nr:hypothetical protein [Elusimicrobiota bacterium]